MLFFQKKVFGLDICDTSIVAIQLKKQRDRIELVAGGRLELEAGIIENGLILNQEKLSQAIKKLLRGTKPKEIKTPYVIASLPSSSVFIHIFDFPQTLTNKQLEGVVKNQAEELLPIPLAELYWTFETATLRGDQREILFAAAEKKLVDKYLKVFEECLLKPIVLDIESISLARALIKDFEKEEGIIICDIGDRTTILTIFDQTGIRSFFNFFQAGNKFTREIAREFKITEEEAEEKKIKYGLSGDSAEKERVKKAIGPVLNELAEEIKKIADYYQAKASRKIKKVILCGGSSKMIDIDLYFSKNLPFQVTIGKPWFKIEVETKKFKPSFLINGFKLNLVQKGFKPVIDYLSINALGLALRVIKRKTRRQRINLLPGFKKYDKLKILVACLLVLIILAAIFIFWRLRSGQLIVPEESLESEKVSKKVPETESEIVVAPTSTPIEFTVFVKVETQGLPLASDEIAGRFLESEIFESKTFLATGEREKEAKASGEVTLINNYYNRNQILVKETRLLSSENILFRLAQKVEIPARGKIKARVYADEEGEKGNIKPTRFSIPGLLPASQEKVYAESNSAMTGGKIKIKIVTAEDIEKAEAQFKEELRPKNLNILKNKLKGKEIFLSELATEEVKSVSSSVKAETEKDKFEIKMKLKSSVLVFKEADILIKALSELKDLLPQGRELIDYQLKEPLYQVDEYNLGAKKAELKINTMANLENI